MIIIPAVFCIFLILVSGQTNDFFPLKILVRQRTISEGSDLYVTCSIYGQKAKPSDFAYLLKNGKGFLQMTMKQNLNDVTFKISNVSLDHSGNYSCFYSTESHNLTAVAGTGQDDVEILVIAHFIPAVLSVAGPASVHEGNRIEFKCSFSRTLHTISNCQFIYCSLKKNKTFLQLQVFDVSRMEAYFVIEGAVGRDSGHYSCLLLPSKCYQTKWKELQGMNEAFLDVKEESISWGALFCGLIVFIVLFGLFLRWIYHKTSFKASFMPWIVSSDREERNTEKLEPMNDEPHEDGEDDSFSVENEEQNQSEVQAAGDEIYSSCERIYHIPDDPPSGPSYACVTNKMSLSEDESKN